MSKKDDFRKQLEAHAEKTVGTEEAKKEVIATLQAFQDEVLQEIQEWAGDLPGLTIVNIQKVRPQRGSVPEVRVFNLDIVAGKKLPFHVAGLAETHIEFFGPNKCAILMWQSGEKKLDLVTWEGGKERRVPGPPWNEETFIGLLQSWFNG